MKKFLIFFLLFFSLFQTPIHAIDPATPEPSNWIAKIIAFFTGNFKLFFSKKYEIDLNRTGKLNEYKDTTDPKDRNDFTTHTLPASLRDSEKKEYLEGVLSGKYPDRDLKINCDAKTVYLKTLAQYIKDNNLTNTCLNKVYDELHVVPQGSDDDVAANSQQANTNMRVPIPASSQKEVITGETLKSNTARNEEVLLKSLIPYSAQQKKDDTGDLRLKYRKFLHLDSWQK